MKIIKRHVYPGSTIYTDGWVGYNKLNEIDDTKEKYERARAYLNKQNPDHEIKQIYTQLHHDALYQDSLLQIEDLKLNLFAKGARSQFHSGQSFRRSQTAPIN